MCRAEPGEAKPSAIALRQTLSQRSVLLSLMMCTNRLQSVKIPGAHIYVVGGGGGRQSPAVPSVVGNLQAMNKNSSCNTPSEQTQVADAEGQQA